MAPGDTTVGSGAIYKVAFAWTEFRSPEFYDSVRAVRYIAYCQVLEIPVETTIVMTNAHFQGPSWGRESWRELVDLGRRRPPLLTIAIICGAEEHRRRIVSEDRAAKERPQDVGFVVTAATRRLIQEDNDDSLCLGVTKLSAASAADQIAAWISERMAARESAV